MFHQMTNLVHCRGRGKGDNMGIWKLFSLGFLSLFVSMTLHALECSKEVNPADYGDEFYQVSELNDQGLALGVVGPESYAKSAAIAAINDYSSFLFALMNNRHFVIKVTELVVCEEAGFRMMVDPRTMEPSAVKAVPMLNDFGGVVGVDVTLPPEGVLFRSQNGLVTSYEGMAVHEIRHAHQINLGMFGTHTDVPDMIAAENDAQALENKVTGNDISYFEDKHGDNASFFDEQGDIAQRRTREVTPTAH